MSIQVVRFEHQGRSGWGVVQGAQVLRIPGEYATTGDLLRGVSLQELSSLCGDGLDLDRVKLLSPVTRNQQFICQGANYRQHMLESGLDPDAKAYNMIFTKASSCIVAADSDVVLPNCVRLLDYEIELGLVLKRDIQTRVEVTEQNLHEFIAGLVIINDYSARDIQLPQMQFYKGKSFRTFGPVGPYLVLLERSEIELIRRLELVLTVNGEVRQQDTTANLVFGPAETLRELSRVQELHAGDLLATGTPAGCALRVPSPLLQKVAALVPERTKWRRFLDSQARRSQYLKPGDIVEAHISSSDGGLDLGRQRNRIVMET